MKVKLSKKDSIEKVVRQLFRNDYIVHKNKYSLKDEELANLYAHIFAIEIWNGRKESAISRDQLVGIIRDQYIAWCKEELNYLLTLE